MNRDQLVTITVALACFAALGTSATTLAATLSSDPDDAVDPDYDQLPIEREDAADLQRQIESNAESDQQASAASERDGTEASSSADGTAERRQRSSQSEDRESDPSAASAAGGGGGESGLSDASEGGLALTDDPVSSLLGLLFSLAVIATVLAIASRYRDRVVALLESEDGGTEETAGDPFAAPPRDANDVFATWDALVRRLDVDPGARTPGECARAATEAGMDANAVHTLRRTFEEVRYGGLPVTEERSRTVREARDSLGLTDTPERREGSE